MVGQDVFLFDDTIRENIRHARPDATDEKIESACREAMIPHRRERQPALRW